MRVNKHMSTLEQELLKVIERNRQTATEKTVEFISSLSEPFLPFKTGKLTQSVKPNTSSIDVTVDYAENALNPISSSGKPKVYDQSVHPKACGVPFEAVAEEKEEEIAEFYVEELFKDE